MTERSSGTRYSRKNSGGTPPSKPYPLSQQLPDRGSKASKCRPTKLIPLPTSATRRQRKQSFQMSSDKANSPSLSQQLPDRGSKASKCRPTKLIPLPTSATRRQRKRSFQMSSDKANSPSLSQQLPDRGSKASKCRPSSPRKNSLSQSPKKEGPAMITIKFNGKPTQIPTSTPITTFLTTHNYNPIHVVVELNEVIIPKESYPTTTLSPDDTLEILTFMGGGQ